MRRAATAMQSLQQFVGLHLPVFSSSSRIANSRKLAAFFGPRVARGNCLSIENLTIFPAPTFYSYADDASWKLMSPHCLSYRFSRLPLYRRKLGLQLARTFLIARTKSTTVRRRKRGSPFLLNVLYHTKRANHKKCRWMQRCSNTVTTTAVRVVQ